MKFKDFSQTFKDSNINFQGLALMLLRSMSFKQSVHLALCTSFVRLSHVYTRQ